MDAVKQGNDAQAQSNTQQPEWLLAMALAGELQFTLGDIARTMKRKFTAAEMLRALASTMIMTETTPEERLAALAEAEAQLAPIIKNALERIPWPKVARKRPDMEIKRATGMAPEMKIDASSLFGPPPAVARPFGKCDCGSPFCPENIAGVLQSIFAPQRGPVTVKLNGQDETFKSSVATHEALATRAGVIKAKVKVSRGGQSREVPERMAVDLMPGDLVDVVPAPVEPSQQVG